MAQIDIFVMMLVIMITAGCSLEPKKIYDGGTLLHQKCAACHNLSMPPKTYEDEKAPPMMALSFHIKDLVKVKNPSEKKPKFIAFFKDYPLNPSKEKSFCDQESLKSYGVMPSMKGEVTIEELEAIATYVYDYYDQEKFLKLMQQKAQFEALPKGEQIAKSHGCFNCHDKIEPRVGPSFRVIAPKSKKEIKEVIHKGSKGRWKGFERSIMPPFKNLSDDEIMTLIAWMKKV